MDNVGEELKPTAKSFVAVTSADRIRKISVVKNDFRPINEDSASRCKSSDEGNDSRKVSKEEVVEDVKNTKRRRRKKSVMKKKGSNRKTSNGSSSQTEVSESESTATNEVQCELVSLTGNKIFRYFYGIEIYWMLFFDFLEHKRPKSSCRSRCTNEPWWFFIVQWTGIAPSWNWFPLFQRHRDHEVSLIVELCTKRDSQIIYCVICFCLAMISLEWTSLSVSSCECTL